ncbi:MAG: polymerase sigma factor [Frankiales bacterium]|nr:polymerase sigma factor [Frankiales bacterium]
MPTAARPADNDVVVEAMVQRALSMSASSGRMTLAELRTSFEAAGIGPDEARAVLRRLTEGGLVISSDGAAESKKPRRQPAARPAARPIARQATRPAGRTVADPAPETPTPLTAEDLMSTDTTAKVDTTDVPAPELVEAPAAAPAAKAPRARKTTAAKAEPAPVVPAVTADDEDEDGEAVASGEAAVVAEEDKPIALDEPPPGIDLVKAYLREIGRVPLLTAVEEVELAKRIEAGLFAAEKLRQSAEEGLKLTPTYKRDFAELVRDGDRAKRHLLEANLRLVVSLAKRYQGRGLDLLDLVQEGNLGLVRAVEKFDYAKGYKFSTYATWWIRQALQRALADQGRTIRVPVHMAELITKVTRVRRELTQSLGRDPSAEEIGLPLEMTAAKVEEIIAFGRDTLSLQSPVGDDEATLGDFITDTESVDPVQAVETQMLQSQLSEVLGSLPERSAIVVRMRFGLDDGRPRTLDEVGRHLGLTRERIRQIERDTLAELRLGGRADGLREYVA